MHERGPFFVDNGILFINGTQVHDLASVLDTTTGELLACGDYDNDNLQQVFSDAFKRYVNKGQREHAHSLMIVHYNEQDFKNLDSVCSIANYELACDDKEKLKEIDPNLGGELCDEIENDTVESSGGKNYEKKQKILKRALEALDPKERINICKMLFDIDEK